MNTGGGGLPARPDPDRRIDVRALTGEEVRLLATARLLACHTMPYLTRVLFALRPLAAPGLGTMAVDAAWRLYVDVDVVRRHWSVEQTAAVLLHEANHVLRAHAERAVAAGVGAADRRRWNIAADVAVNDDLITALEGTRLGLPGWPLQPATFDLRTGQSVEAYFAQLTAAHVKRVVQHSIDHLHMAGGCGSGAGAADVPDGRGGVLDDVRHPAAMPVPVAEQDLVRHQVAQDIRAHLQSGIGRVPGGLARLVDELLPPATVDWRRLLRGAIRQALTTGRGSGGHRYHRPSRRRPPGGVVLAVPVRPRPRVVTLIDTSGSMQAPDLAAALAEVEGICTGAGLRGPDHRVVCVDVVAHAAVPVRSARDLQLVGGGGTDLRVGFAVAAGMRPRPDLLVVLTDGWTPWPEVAPRGMRCVVGLVSSGVVSPERPVVPGWATVVEVRVGG